jgi:hypothetical protein
VNPATAIGWKGRAGQLVSGAAADMVVIRQRNSDPYRNLIEATEEDIELVLVDGKPVYGEPKLMRALKAEKTELLVPRRGRAKALALDARSNTGCGSFGEIRERLQTLLRFENARLVRSLNRLKVRRALSPNPPPVQQEYPFFLAIGDEPLEAGEVERFVLAVFPEGLAPFSLDPVFVADDDEFARVMQDPALVERRMELRPYYGSLLS